MEQRGTRHRVPTSRSSTASAAKLRKLRPMLRSTRSSGRPMAWNGKICDHMWHIYIYMYIYIYMINTCMSLIIIDYN